MEDAAKLLAQPQMTGPSAADEELGTSTNGDIRAGQPSQERHHVGTETAMSALDMSNVTAALPEYMYGQVPQAMYRQPFAHPAHNSSVMYPYQGPQYTGAAHTSYSVPYPAQMHPHGFAPQRPYAPYPINSNLGPGQQMYHGQPFFPQQSAMSPSVQGSFSSTSPGQTFGQAPSPMYGLRGPGQYHGPQMRVDGFGNTMPGSQRYSHSDFHDDRNRGSATSLKVPSVLRGPPRKPKQSGHALWVGNLPPGTNIMELKDHFSRDAIEDIESVFLISKSNCAFVNYKSEKSCTAAMGRFHDSRFNGVRLVCRLRRGSSPTSATIPVGANQVTAMDGISETITTQSSAETQEETKKEDDESDIQTRTKVKERYFIIKSLTIEDLERSVHSGIWATQSHNEEALNKAYQTAESVYLIFSANKSGEYFGYARMDSAIDNDSAAANEISPIEPQVPQQPSANSASESPLTIPTPATATAPKGYIIDDSARGTIFWEAEYVAQSADSGAVGTSPVTTDSGNASGEEVFENRSQSPANLNSSVTSTTFGKPFKITWISTERLPFYRTRGLRNPWNTNREVKIARDGTELEPGVGRKLVGMFNTVAVAGRTPQHGHYPEMMAQIPGHGPAYRSY